MKSKLEELIEIFSEEVFKPSLYDSKLVEEMIEKSRSESFDKFSKYFEKSGLKKEERKAVKDFLEKLCKKTGYAWRPGLCRYIPKVIELAKQTLKESCAKNYFYEIVLKNYDDRHFFLLMLSFEGKKFVVDPTGVPEKERTWVFPDDIKPYFGLIEKAKGFHRVVYQNSL
ncbi:MAG: hypothetical protein QXS48_04585 [Candidatus Aenigmatarchaeota archaeon]